MRNEENYSQVLAIDNISLTGIKVECMVMD